MIECLNLSDRVDRLAGTNERVIMDDRDGRTKLGLDHCTSGSQRDTTHPMPVNAFDIDRTSVIIRLDDTHFTAGKSAVGTTVD